MGLEGELMRSLCDAFCGLGSSECVDANSDVLHEAGCQQVGYVYGSPLSALRFSLIHDTLLNLHITLREYSHCFIRIRFDLPHICSHGFFWEDYCCHGRHGNREHTCQQRRRGSQGLQLRRSLLWPYEPEA